MMEYTLITLIGIGAIAAVKAAFLIGIVYIGVRLANRHSGPRHS
jgi:hypothetical protein